MQLLQKSGRGHFFDSRKAALSKGQRRFVCRRGKEW